MYAIRSYYEIVNGQVYINNKISPDPEGVQFNYFVQTTGSYISDDMLREMGISKDDQVMFNIDQRNNFV